MTKEKITQIQTAFNRLSNSSKEELPRMAAEMSDYLHSVARSRDPLPEEFVAALCQVSGEVDRACGRLRDLGTLQRELGPFLARIADRINWTHERRATERRWTHVVAEHCLKGATKWVFAGTLRECLRFVEDRQEDANVEEYSIRPQGFLQSGQRLEAFAARRRDDASLEEALF